MKDLEIFIPGETIDLCIPTQEFARESNWYSWFNNPDITRYLGERGNYQNTPEKQEKFFLAEKDKRLILIISTKKKIYKGVVSLSFSDKSNKQKTCNIAIVTDFSIEPENSPYASLEAIARITEHGFKKLSMKRISDVAHIKLGNWQQRMELLGYRVEGVYRDESIRSSEKFNAMNIACLYDDYLSIIENRGSLWDSLEKMKKRIKQLPKISYRDQLSNFCDSKGSEYYKKIFNL